MMPEYLSVTTTTDSPHSAGAIAAALVDTHLAACVQVDGPLTSRYRWEGKVETATEWRCTIKIRADRFAGVAAAIRALHPYGVPQILATAIECGDPDYLAWIDAAASDG